MGAQLYLLSPQKVRVALKPFWDFYVWALGPLSSLVGQPGEEIWGPPVCKDSTLSGYVVGKIQMEGVEKNPGRDKGGDLQLQPHREFRGSQSRPD